MNNKEQGSEIIEIKPSVKVDGLSVHVSPAWGRCVRMDINTGKHLDSVLDVGSYFSIHFYDLTLVDQLIQDLTRCKIEIEKKRR
jgi:hypothetical protein